MYTAYRRLILDNLKQRAYFGNLDVDGRMILKLVFKKNGTRMWIGSRDWFL
jgi:hypothetical protein